MVIAEVASELSPFSKTGGLGDVLAGLPKMLAHLGHEVSVFTPYYRHLAAARVAGRRIGEFTVVVAERSFAVKLYAYPGKTPRLYRYFVGSDEFFGGRERIYGEPDDHLRFLVFCKGTIAAMHWLKLRPDVLHLHDWQAGLIANLIREPDDPFFEKTAIVYTLHNLLFQLGGDWWRIPDDRRDDGRGPVPETPERLPYVNAMRRGIRHADVVNTVSERYAREIMTPAFGQGLDPVLRARRRDVFGIINGIDAEVYNPATDAHLPCRYKWWDIEGKRQSKLGLQRRLGLAAGPDTPLLGMVNRLTRQKGVTLLMQALPQLLKRPVQLVITGDGDASYIEALRAAQRQYPDRLALVIPFHEKTASQVYAAADLYLMPSRFEPCGISQLIGLRYGATPVVHRTGGLADTVTEFDATHGTGNGFVFTSYTVPAFLAAVDRALALYRDQATWVPLTMRAMRAVYSWELPARQYSQLFRLAIRRHQKRL